MIIKPEGKDITIVDNEDNVIAWLDMSFFLDVDNREEGFLYSDRDFQCQMHFYQPHTDDPVDTVKIGGYLGEEKKPIFKLIG